MSSRSASTGVSTRSTRSARCSASRAVLRRRPMPTFIPARGRTLHLADVCVNRIGTPQCSTQWSDVYTNVPEQYIEQQHVKIDVPELASSKTPVTIDTPAVSIEPQNFSFQLPQFKTEPESA